MGIASLVCGDISLKTPFFLFCGSLSSSDFFFLKCENAKAKQKN
jgi:hypothetical protein